MRKTWKSCILQNQTKELWFFSIALPGECCSIAANTQKKKKQTKTRIKSNKKTKNKREVKRYVWSQTKNSNIKIFLTGCATYNRLVMQILSCFVHKFSFFIFVFSIFCCASSSCACLTSEMAFTKSIYI